MRKRTGVGSGVCPGALRGAIGVLAILFGIPASLETPPLAAQTMPTTRDVSEFSRAVSSCHEGTFGDPGLCVDALGVYRTARAGLITSFSGGSSLPGSASTLGRRVPGVPRIAVSGSLQAQRIELVDLTGAADRPGRRTSGSGTVFGARGTVAGGVFHGFSPQPTVGGILAVDLVASLGYAALPEGAGFESGTVGWGVGARLGILRESFTLPGITLSVMRHSVGRIEFPTVGAGRLGVESSAWTTRAVVGKDLFGLGLYAGAGRDRASGTMELLAPRSTGPGMQNDFRRDGLPVSRNTAFAGASYTLLVTQVSGELGWASGHDAVAGGLPSTDGTLFLTLSGRILF